MRFVLLAALLVASTVSGQTCEEQCFMACVISSQEVCDRCMESCTPERRRVRPDGPPIDPWLGGYTLPRTIGVIQIAYDLSNRPVTRHMSSLELSDELAANGFSVMKIWMDSFPFDGSGKEFCYIHPRFGYEICDTTPLTWSCDGYYDGGPRTEDVMEFWHKTTMKVIFVRFQRWGYTEGACIPKTFPPYYAIAKKLYQEIGDRDLTVVFTDWEEDWYPWGCPTNYTNENGNYIYPFKYAQDWYSTGCIDQCTYPVVPEDILTGVGQEFIDDCLDDGEGIDECAEQLREMYGVSKPVEECTDYCGRQLVEARYSYLEGEIEQRQTETERARKEAYLELGHRPKLRIMTSVVVNRYPFNQRDHEVESGIKTLAERISGLQHRPDLIGLSYWNKGDDPFETLDWLTSVTGYPARRIYIDEFGSMTTSKQVQRYSEYIPAFWDYGIKIVNIWMWKQTWCATDPDKNLGVWEQKQPCDGKVVFGEPTDGFYELQQLIYNYER